MPSPDYRRGEQRVVVYDRAGEETVYATAYSNDQAADVIDECAQRYGAASKPRQIYAKDHPPL